MRNYQEPHGQKWGLYSSELKERVIAVLEGMDLEQHWNDGMSYYNSTEISEEAIFNLDITEEEEADVHYIVMDYCNEMSLATC